MGISLGLVGLGSFGSAFARLFKSHPLVDRIALCDAEEEKLRKFADLPEFQDKLNQKDVFFSLDDICRTDLDAIVIITQPWLHAPQCIQVMESGKHVYSAVPVITLPDFTEVLDWCGRVIDCVQRTGKQYMLGETTYYRPQTQFCRRQAAAGAFGDFVYAEGEYAHDVDSNCSLRQVNTMRQTGKVGAQYESLVAPYHQRGCKTSPMSYPTHSVSGPLSVMGAKPLRVSAGGYRNRNQDPFFHDSEFSNLVANYYLDNGAVLRIAEMREISANTGLKDEDFRIFGTRGSYSCNNWCENGRIVPDGAKHPNVCRAVTDAQMFEPLPKEVASAFKYALNPAAKPEDDFQPSGHGGSHPYLVHEFCCAVAEQRLPAVNAWDAARYMAMGAAAHASALRDGELLPVLDFGDAPRT